jgi:Holliday junction resolvase RusA-like endonuclease
MQTPEPAETAKRRAGRPRHHSTSVDLPIAPSVNRLWRNVAGLGRVRTTDYRRWLKAAGWELVVQRMRPISGHVAVRIFAGPTERRRDLDNVPKAVCDLLVVQEIIEDDALVAELFARWDAGVEPGRMSVEVRQTSKPKMRQSIAEAGRINDAVMSEAGQ